MSLKYTHPLSLLTTLYACRFIFHSEITCVGRESHFELCTCSYFDKHNIAFIMLTKTSKLLSHLELGSLSYFFGDSYIIMISYVLVFLQISDSYNDTLI